MPNAVATKCVSKKHWLDIDIDFVASYKTELDYYGRSYQANIQYRLREVLSGLGTPILPSKIVIVYTKGGIHLLFPTKIFDKNINPTRILTLLQNKFGEVTKEIEVTSGGCPIPGCFQRGHLVKYEEVDFSF